MVELRKDSYPPVCHSVTRERLTHLGCNGASQRGQQAKQMLIPPQLPPKQSTYVLQGAWLHPQASKVHARGFPDYRDNCALSRVCCSQPGTSRAPATRHNTQRQRVPGRLDSEGKCRKPVNRCRLSSKEPGGPGCPPPTNPYQLITLQGSGPPWEESIPVHSFLRYKLPAHLTYPWWSNLRVGREA